MHLFALLPLLISSLSWAEPPETAYANSVRLIDRLYLAPEEFNEAALLKAAAERLSDEVHWLMVDSDGSTVHLIHGSGKPIGSISVASMDGLPQALIDLEKMVEGAGYELGDAELRLAILKGLPDALDRYSRLLADSVRDRFDVRLKGTMVGIGANLRWKEKGLSVTSVSIGGPADLGGLQRGDILLRIDDKPVTNMPVHQAIQRLRGDKGTEVFVHVQGAGDKEKKLTFTRTEVIVSNVDHRVLEGVVGYVHIENISQKTVHNLGLALSDLNEKGAMKRGLVLDLRGNTGGSMKEAGRAADAFVEEGLLLRTVGRNGGRVQNLQERMDATPGGWALDVPLIVLVNERTASGAEILAGALLELNRAALVGTRTYGKGSVQKLYPLDDATELKLTVAHYLLVNDREIHDLGLVPDAVVGAIDVDEDGLHYSDWDEARQRTPWEEIVPWVRDQTVNDADGALDDLPLELARRALMQTVGPTREAALVALAEVTSGLRVEEEGRLVAAMEHQGVNWSPAEEEVAAMLEVDVRITVEPWEGRPDVLMVKASVHNRGEEPLARALVELSCWSASQWDGMVIPVGSVQPGQTQVGVTALSLDAGVGPREDVVEIRLRADKRASLRVGNDVLASKSTPVPNIQLTTRLVDDHDGTWRAEVTVINDSDTDLRDVEVRFAWPADGVPVELVDSSVLMPVVGANDRMRGDLILKVGENPPAEIPLKVRVYDERNGRLANWPLLLPIDGSLVSKSAPHITQSNMPVSAPMGALQIPIIVHDDRAVDYIVVYAHGRKVAWSPGGKGKATLLVESELWEGANSLYVWTEDSDGLAAEARIPIRGEAPAAADTSEEEVETAP